MAKKKKASKSKVKKGVVKELFDLEIDEVSAVDMAAIGESFYITKSINTNNKKGAKVAKGKKLPLIKAMPKWSETIQKNDEGKCGEHCHFCGITKEVEAEQMGAGLRNSVCLGCALEHFEKGVFDSCLELTFDIEKFKVDFPEIKLHELSKEDDSDEGEDDADSDDENSEDEGEDKGKKDKKDGEGEDSDEDDDADSDEDDADENSEDDEAEKNKAADSATAGDDEGDDDSELNNADLSKRLGTVEKSLEDVSGMLERSLELHDVAAGAFNEVVTLTFASLDMVMMLIEERMEDGEEEAVQQNRSIFGEINDSIKSVREEVSKAGAKISGKRMAVLREIATKLSELIESVMTAESKKGVTKSAMDEVQKSLKSFKEELKEEIKTSSSSLKEDIDEKLKEVNTKLDDFEQSGGASFGLGDEEEDDSDDDLEETNKGESVFSGLVGLDDITKSIEKKRRHLNR